MRRGMKPSEQRSLLDVLGLRDPDLAAPGHDDLVLALVEELTAGRIDHGFGAQWSYVGHTLERELIAEGRPVGFVDLVGHYVRPFENDVERATYAGSAKQGVPRSLAFEVKVSVPSVGQAIRQIKAMRRLWISDSYTSPPFVLVTPPGAVTAEWAGLLRGEGIRLLEIVARAPANKTA